MNKNFKPRLAPILALTMSATLGLTACGAQAGPSSSNSLHSDTAVFADYGGTTRTARQQSFMDPFSSKTGVRGVFADADPGKLALFAQQGRADWDVIDLDNWDVVRFSKLGYLAKLPSDVPRVDAVPKEFQDYATGGYTVANGFAYRGDKVQPKSWADFFDTERFPGKRALPSFAFQQIEAALMADGVGCNSLYPLDYDRAFKKLDALRKDVLFYDSFGQAVQYLSQGSVTMAILPNSRASVPKEQGLPIDFQWNQAFSEWTAAAVLKDAPHQDAAFELVKSMADPQNQAQFAKATKYGPTNSAALKLLDKETLASIPNSHTKETCSVDAAALGDAIVDYTKRYSAWVSK